MGSQPIHILQWGMTTGLGGIETFVMNVYRHMDRTKVQFDFLQGYHDGPLHFEDEIQSMGGTIYRVLVPQRDSLIRSRTCLPRFFSKPSGDRGGAYACEFLLRAAVEIRSARWYWATHSAFP